MNLDDLLSPQLGPMSGRVQSLVHAYKEIWKDTPADPPRLPSRYSQSQKKGLEKEFSLFVDQYISGNQDHFNMPASESIEFEELTEKTHMFLQKIMAGTDIPFREIFDSRFSEATRVFLEKAKAFDPEIDIASVYQALRNVWIMNTLQFYLEKPVACTEAVFGYSMIYPYLDNLLDDNRVTISRKLTVLKRLRCWLEGKEEQSEGQREECLRILVQRIEGQFPRTEYPGVYQSMLSIYNAQVKSMLQQKIDAGQNGASILDISLEKGGTSVLADGYLAGGTLNPSQEDFCFGFGTFLQLVDDLQDCLPDRENGHLTLFSQRAGQTQLDGLVYKLFNYTQKVAGCKLGTHKRKEILLNKVITRSCGFLYMEAAGRYKNLFSQKCVRRFGRSFPVRFSYLKNLRDIQIGFIPAHKKIKELDSASLSILTLTSRLLT